MCTHTHERDLRLPLRSLLFTLTWLCSKKKPFLHKIRKGKMYFLFVENDFCIIAYHFDNRFCPGIIFIHPKKLYEHTTYLGYGALFSSLLIFRELRRVKEMQQLQHRPSFNLDATEMQQRYNRDATEMQQRSIRSLLHQHACCIWRERGATDATDTTSHLP